MDVNVANGCNQNETCQAVDIDLQSLPTRNSEFSSVASLKFSSFTNITECMLCDPIVQV